MKKSVCSVKRFCNGSLPTRTSKVFSMFGLVGVSGVQSADLGQLVAYSFARLAGGGSSAMMAASLEGWWPTIEVDGMW
jgi:hypothetical protein